MAWELSQYGALKFGAALITAALAVVGWRRDDPLSVPFTGLMVGTTTWALADAIKMGFDTLAPILFFEKVAYIGVVITIAAWLVLTVRYAGVQTFGSRRTLALLAVEPVLTLALAWTNYRNLVWESFGTTTVGGATVFAPTYGEWYWVHLVYSYLLVVVGIVILVRVFFTASRLYRTQSAVLIVGAVVPFVANIAYNVTSDLATTIDFTTVAFALTGIVIGLGLFYFDLLELSPAARDLLMDELTDGVVVVDEDGTVVDYNPVASHALDGLSVGADANTAFARPVAELTGTDVTAVIDGRERIFQAQSKPLEGQRKTAGYLVLLRDVTDLRDREQRLEVLNRTLRHNIRNDMTVVLGTLTRVEDQVTEADRRVVQLAREKAADIVDLSEKARDIERTLRADGATASRLDLAALIDELCATVRDTYPDASVTLETESAVVRVPDPGLIENALENAIENAIEHNDAETPNVWISLARQEGRAVVRIADDGPTIPAEELDVLAEGTETQLRHGSGVGLWLVYWAVTVSGGTLEFEERDPKGNVVVIDLPIAQA